MTLRTPESCAQCRFDATQYDLADALGTLRAVPAMWQQLTEGVADDVLAQRPAPGTWSATEYASHSADVTQTMGLLLHLLRTGADEDLVFDDPGPPPQEPETAGGAAAQLERLAANVQRLHRGARRLGPEGEPAWARQLRLGDAVLDGAWGIRHAVHDLTHHVSDAGRGLHLLGAGAPTQEGTVAQLNLGGGGVPKRPVEVAEVGDRGLLGDRQKDRRHHGRPLQALCLWSADVIEALQGEGHPIHAGATGENVTISGIDWSTMRTGVQLLIGEVVAEVSAYATPCKKNARWFLGRDPDRMLHDRHPGWSRVYAWVREPGTIRTGDPVVVEP